MLTVSINDLNIKLCLGMKNIEINLVFFCICLQFSIAYLFKILITEFCLFTIYNRYYNLN